jgi:hypothetical protein
VRRESHVPWLRHTHGRLPSCLRYHGIVHPRLHRHYTRGATRLPLHGKLGAMSRMPGVHPCSADHHGHLHALGCDHHLYLHALMHGV